MFFFVELEFTCWFMCFFPTTPLVGSRFDRAGASRHLAKRFTARWLVEAHARRRTAPPRVLHRPFCSIYEAPRFFLRRCRREEKHFS